jgi:hypothetical protein
VGGFSTLRFSEYKIEDYDGTDFLINTPSDNFFLFLAETLSRRERLVKPDTEEYNGKKISLAPDKTGVFYWYPPCIGF